MMISPASMSRRRRESADGRLVGIISQRAEPAGPALRKSSGLFAIPACDDLCKAGAPEADIWPPLPR